MKAKYAIRALLVLSNHTGKLVQSKAIAKEADAPIKFLEAILLELKNADIVQSRRGIFGGYGLSRPAEQITLGEIVRLIDGMLAPIPCASVSAYRKCEDCIDERSCSIRHAMIEVRNATSNVLDKKTLAMMLEEQKSRQAEQDVQQGI